MKALIFAATILLTVSCGKDEAASTSTATPWTAAQKSEFTATCKLNVNNVPNAPNYCSCMLNLIADKYAYADVKANPYTYYSKDSVGYQNCLKILSGN